MMGSARLIAFSFTVTMILASTKEPRKSVSVCELLADLQSHSNKVVVVRGELLRTEEGTYLIDKMCPKPLITSGFVWANPIGIWLAEPPSESAQKPIAPSPDMPVDPIAYDLLSKHAADPNVRIWVTVVGTLETRESFVMVLKGDGKTVPYGYGHLNASPAQILIHRMNDVVVETRRSAGRKRR